MAVAITIVVATDGRGFTAGGEFVPVLMLFVFALHMITILGSLGLMIYYIIHVVKNEALSSNSKIIWIVLFFFFNMLSQPFYWYMNIWKEPAPAFAPTGQLGGPDASSWARPEETRVAEEYIPRQPPDWR